MLRLIFITAAVVCVFKPEADPAMAIFWMLFAIWAQLWKNGSVR
jgi:hypothetical protein